MDKFKMRGKYLVITHRTAVGNEIANKSFNIPVTPEEAAQGATVLEQYVRDSDTHTCPECHGKGPVTGFYDTADGRGGVLNDCSLCKGFGIVTTAELQDWANKEMADGPARGTTADI